MTCNSISGSRAIAFLMLFYPMLVLGAADQQDLESFRQMLLAQQAEIDALKQTLGRQQAELGRQRMVIAALEREPGRAGVQVGSLDLSEQGLAQGDAEVQAEPTVAVADREEGATALAQRLEALEQRVRNVPEDPLAALGDPSFPGAWRVPGTNAAMRIGGYAKMNIVDSFDPLAARDRFIVGSIPPDGEIVDGAAKEFALTARQSRVNLDLRDQTEMGSLRAFVEGDFAGTGGAFRLRHAFGQFHKMLAGQTWSTLMDLNVSPEELDFEGINGRINARQPQLRFFPSIGDKINLKIALEDPRPDVSGGTGVSELPDIVFGIDNVALGLLGWMERRQGWDVRAAVIGRQIKARAFDVGEEKSATGWGVTASGRIPMSFWDERDQFLWQLNYGEGIGRYINDLGTLGGQDAIFAPDGDLKPLPVFAGYVSYQHWWSSKWRSNTTFSWVEVNTFEFQSSPAYVSQFGAPYERTLRGSLNLLYSPVPRVEAGAELLWGERRNANNTSGDAAQLQLSIRYLY